MKPGSFMLDNQDSELHGAFIQDRPSIESPRRRVEFRQSFGQSGDTPFDEEAYDNTAMDLIMYVVGTKTKTASMNRDTIHELFDSGTYMDFIPYFDPTKIYKVMATTFPSFEAKYYYDEGQAFSVTLTVKPYKYYVDSPMKTLTTAGSILNPHSKSALPRIKIYGSGDVTLKVHGVDFVIKNVVDHIILDSQMMIAYREVSGVVTSENSKTYTRNYPYLQKGNNAISWTGSVTKVEIEPRWRTLA